MLRPTQDWDADQQHHPDRLPTFLRCRPGGSGLFERYPVQCEGCRKPEPRIYEIACERLGVEPVACVFLDDLGINLKPPGAMGMTTIKVVDPEEAIGNLRRSSASPRLTLPSHRCDRHLERQLAKARIDRVKAWIQAVGRRSLPSGNQNG
ncbi:MAG: hypothetical protein Ct9H300mP12_02130 [Acidimicrobiales bacterium]|nr:MAG: hypothetical protein Ct9H300mP12_02130 [Acidimicrobiales bacterium]